MAAIPVPATAPAAPAGWTRWVWLAALGVGVVLAVVAVQAPRHTAAVAAALSGALPVIAITVGLRARRPTRPRPWIAVAVGLATYWSVAAPGIAGLWDATALPAMILTVVGYTALLAGIIGVLSDGGSDGDLATLLEALVLAAAAAIIVWFLVIAPARDARGGIDLGDTIGAIAYPALDMALFALAGRTLLRYRRIGGSLWLLLPALLGSAASDAVGLFAFLNNTSSPAWIGAGGSLMANAFVAAAALHPSLARPLVAGARPMGRFLRLRIAFVGGATLIAPALLLLSGPQTHLIRWRIDPIEVALGAIVVSALVVGDLYLLLVGLDGSLRTRVALEGELERRALSDSLTALPNRAAFVTRLEQQFARDRDRVALLFCDLDDFKTVNDTLGHSAGDELLVEVGQRLRAAIRPSDLAARLGGDEFAILVGGLTDPEDAELVASRILGAFTTPVVIAGQAFGVRISIGIALGADALIPSDLMRDADVAMYLAKGHGKGRFERFRPEAQQSGPSRLAMRAGLERALVEERLSLAFQPVVDLATDEIIGVEVLARWDDPNFGLVPPAEFIPLAEQSGLIGPLGHWVLRGACEELRGWLDAGVSDDLALFVNVSAVQLANRTFADEVGRILAATGVPARNLVLEITESAVLDAEAALATFEAIRALGVRIAIDDFGTGYSSIGYLGRYPVDILKIDRSFVKAVGDGRQGDSLVRTILALAASLSLTTVAEGIETEDQRTAVARMGCALGQGYLLGAPVGPREIRARLSAPAAPASAPRGRVATPAARPSPR